jgi:macrolide transport system ATP-binding/permease protein
MRSRTHRALAKDSPVPPPVQPPSGGRLVASRIYAMRAADPVVLLAAGLIVAAVALLATMIPAVRASRIDPVRALRSE